MRVRVNKNSDQIITRDEVEKVLKKLNVGKTPGSDGVATKYLRSRGNLCGERQVKMYGMYLNATKYPTN